MTPAADTSGRAPGATDARIIISARLFTVSTQEPEGKVERNPTFEHVERLKCTLCGADAGAKAMKQRTLP